MDKYFIHITSSPPDIYIYAYVNQVSIGSNNRFSPTRHQAIIGTSAGLLLIEPLWTKFSEILTETQNVSFTKCI